MRQWRNPEDEHRLEEFRTKFILMGLHLWVNFERHGVKTTEPVRFAICQERNSGHFAFKPPYNGFYYTLDEVLRRAVEAVSTNQRRYPAAPME